MISVIGIPTDPTVGASVLISQHPSSSIRLEIKMFYTYILQSSKDNSYYIGSTIDIIKRVEKHNKGYSQYTKTKRPWDLVYKE